MTNEFLPISLLQNNLLNNNFTFCVPKTFLPYVDDCFSLFDNEEDADVFLSILNNLHLNLKFIFERGGICMPSPDVYVKIEEGTFLPLFIVQKLILEFSLTLWLMPQPRGKGCHYVITVSCTNDLIKYFSF